MISFCKARLFFAYNFHNDFKRQMYCKNKDSTSHLISIIKYMQYFINCVATQFINLSINNIKYIKRICEQIAHVLSSITKY